MNNHTAKQKYLIVVVGATASGKTAAAVQIASHFGSEIVSADSRQIYAEMSIGTAKPTADEMRSIPHHFIGHKSIHEPYSAGDYEREALATTQSLLNRDGVAVVVGGTGLYLRALLEGLDEFPSITSEAKKAVTELYAMSGITGLQTELAHHDPRYFEQVDTQNTHRLMRALSVVYSTGQPFSSFLQKHPTHDTARLPDNTRIIKLGIRWSRTTLYDRINQRVDAMITAGLEQEAQGLYAHRHLVALQTVGYQELFDYFGGNSTLEYAIDKIQQHTRNYAKRQLTWFSKDDAIHWFDADGISSDTLNETVLQYLEDVIKKGS